jgi:DNA-binding response OmpR family regulator
MTPIGPDQITPGRRLTVLVVEDDFLIAMDLETTLERRGWRVLGPAPSVKDALRILETERPDVALLDVNLGREMVTPVALALRSLHVPFVLSSACGPGALDEVEVLAAAPNVGKPASERRLVAALEQAADGADAVGASAIQGSAFVLRDRVLPGIGD